MAPVDEGQPRGEDRIINITFEWAKQVLGMLLIAELLTTFLCGCCASSLSTWVGSGCAGKIGFLDFVTWTAFLNILIDMIIRILGLWERLLWIFRHPVVHLVLCGLAVAGFLIASSLVASCSKYVYNGGAAVAAAIFGFISLILFGFEAFLHFKRYRNMESEGRRQTEEHGKADII
ncbi:CKLF-like MARVEL transmembrane domain-containing protein 4 [Exaiptasia diaphana]|uniref:MARVEL domain-containing protein n=1 Tax=Exaiptasia diaphana TaxID=2652724 RepID=A0A913Y6K8_EXADI|nr:CKLF-like MARVEL transmembrane domain-containing protein 4 [Exaiptasia diaphana]